MPVIITSQRQVWVDVDGWNYGVRARKSVSRLCVFRPQGCPLLQNRAGAIFRRALDKVTDRSQCLTTSQNSSILQCEKGACATLICLIFGPDPTVGAKFGHAKRGCFLCYICWLMGDHGKVSKQAFSKRGVLRKCIIAYWTIVTAATVR